MIEVSRAPILEPGHRAFEMCEAVVGRNFLSGWLPELTKVYHKFFDENNIAPEERIANPTVAVTVKPGAPHSWFWLFVCQVPSADFALKKKKKNRNKQPQLQVPAYFLIDGPAATSTLARDMPHARLPAPIDIDTHSEQLWKAVDDAKLPSLAPEEVDEVIAECQSAFAAKKAAAATPANKAAPAAHANEAAPAAGLE